MLTEVYGIRQDHQQGGSTMPIWGFLLAAILVIALPIAIYYFRRADFGNCPHCSKRMTEENVYHRNGDTDICVECYSKMMLDDEDEDPAFRNYLERYIF